MAAGPSGEGYGLCIGRYSHGGTRERGDSQPWWQESALLAVSFYFLFSALLVLQKLAAHQMLDLMLIQDYGHRFDHFPVPLGKVYTICSSNRKDVVVFYIPVLLRCSLLLVPLFDKHHSRLTSRCTLHNHSKQGATYSITIVIACWTSE